MSNLTKQARIFATRAHAAIDHRRKYTGEPYIVHPIEVAEIVRAAGGTDVMIAAAYLHDVVEDTPTTLTEILLEFGFEVANLVGWLTDVSKPEDGNRAARKGIDLKHSASAPAEAHTVKLADLISNTASITKHDPKFAKLYIREKDLLLDVLTKGDRGLHKRATKQVKDYKDSL